MSILGTVLGTVTSIGAGSLATKALAKHLPQNASKLAKVGYFFGLVGLSGAAGKAASDYVESQVNSVEKAINEIRGVYDEAKENADAAEYPQITQNEDGTLNIVVKHEDGTLISYKILEINEASEVEGEIVNEGASNE